MLCYKAFQRCDDSMDGRSPLTRGVFLPDEAGNEVRGGEPSFILFPFKLIAFEVL